MLRKSVQTALLGENSAADHLMQQGYKLLCRNYRVKSGEIDIIAERQGTIVFIEVKARSTTTFGSPAEAVNYRKQRKIIAAAMQFLREQTLFGKSLRFDVMEVFIEKEAITINHIINAFGR